LPHPSWTTAEDIAAAHIQLKASHGVQEAEISNYRCTSGLLYHLLQKSDGHRRAEHHHQYALHLRGPSLGSTNYLKTVN